MKLEPPVQQYLSGDNPTHTSLKALGTRLGIPQEKLLPRLAKRGFINEQGKLTSEALHQGLVDTCEGKGLWNVARVREALMPKPEAKKPQAPKKIAGPTGVPKLSESSDKTAAPSRTEPAWVDLDTIGTYFGVGKVVLGRWLDQLGLRAIPTVEKNESGDYDMLDMANQAKKKQAAGFLGKEPTEKALERGYARKLTVVNRKQKEIEITQWNLDLVKAVLVKAGHPLDTEHKMAYKGKGRNGNVQVNGMDQRAKELYVEWAKLYQDPKTRWKIQGLFRGQPQALLVKVEELMKMPGYLTEGKYLQET